MSPPTFGESQPGRIEENGDLVEELRQTQAVRECDDNICFLFPEETGASSFLAHIVAEYSSTPELFVTPRIPIQVDLRDQRGSYRPAVERLIKSSFPVNEHSQFGWNARTIDQPFALLVDNYDPLRVEHVEWMAEAHRVLPRARFLVCVKSPLAGMQSARATASLKLPFGHRVWSLYPLNRRQVRSMVTKFGLPQNLNPNIIVEEVFSKFRAVGIPLSGPLVAMYLTVLKEQKKYSPINTSSVMENFLEISLDKRKSLIVFQDDFDYREQINLLSILAQHFIEMGVEYVEASECITFIEKHYRVTGIKRDVSKIVTYFCDKGILEAVGTRIYFKYNIIFSYLIAYRMSGDAKFRGHVLADDNMHNFVTELDIYFGINRGDLDGLERIATRYEKLLKEVTAEFGPLLDAKAAARLELPRADNVEAFVTQVAERIGSQVAEDKDDDRDDRVQLKADTPSQFVQKFTRKDTQDSLVQWVKVLCCYSVVIKNSEDFDKATKEKHLHRIFDGWEKGCSFAFQMVALLMSEGMATVGEHKFEFRAKSVTDPKVVRAIVASVPRYISYYCGIYLGSGKLEAIIRRLELTGLAEFLKVGMLVDLRVDAFLGEVAGFRRNNQRNGTLLESMLWKLRDSFLRFGLDKGYLDAFQRTIAELHADILGLGGQLRDRRIGEMLKKLSELRLLKRMRGE